MPWFEIVVLAFVALLIPTAYAGFIGAPYAPTWLKVVRKAFEAIKLGKGDTLIDLGAGDGRIVIEAAKRGAKAIGYELSPIMFAIAKLRVGKKGKIKFGNFYKADLSRSLPRTQRGAGATVLFAFLHPRTMPRLLAWLKTQTFPQGKYLLVYAFPFQDIPPLETVTLPNQGTIYIYNLQKLTKPDTRNS